MTAKAILFMLLATIAITATAYQNDFCSVGVSCSQYGKYFGNITPPTALPLLKTVITHNGFIVSNDTERINLMNRFLSVGIGNSGFGISTWSTPTEPVPVQANYCGNNITVYLGGQVAPSVAGIPIPGVAFWEILQFASVPGQPSLFSDNYAVVTKISFFVFPTFLSFCSDIHIQLFSLF